jgi:hypothetical protein
MQGEIKERWLLRREQAVEQNPNKLMALVKEIDDLLANKHDRLIKARISKLPENPARARSRHSSVNPAELAEVRLGNSSTTRRPQSGDFLLASPTFDCTLLAY